MIAIFSLLVLPAMLLAAPPGKASVSAATDTAQVTPGQPFWVGLTFKITPGWHIYWQNPGDSGIPPAVTWTLPAGFSAGELQYPLPHTFATSGLVNFGYGQTTTLLVQIIPPATLPDGPITLAANLNWLVCKDVCLPESDKVVVVVSAETADKPLIDAALKALPAPNADGVLQAKLTPADAEKNTLTLKLTWAGDVQDVELYPAARENWGVKTTDLRTADGTTTATLTLTPFGPIASDATQPMVVVYKQDNRREGVTVDLPLRP